VFVVPVAEGQTEEEIGRRAFRLRKLATHRIPRDGARCPIFTNATFGQTLLHSLFRFYISSLSTRTVVYKGQFDPCQLWDYYTELRLPELETHLCIVHTRFQS
jgi:glutamate synthase domain-containing protein 1